MVTRAWELSEPELSRAVRAEHVSLTRAFPSKQARAVKSAADKGGDYVSSSKEDVQKHVEVWRSPNGRELYLTRFEVRGLRQVWECLCWKSASVKVSGEYWAAKFGSVDAFRTIIAKLESTLPPQ